MKFREKFIPYEGTYLVGLFFRHFSELLGENDWHYLTTKPLSQQLKFLNKRTASSTRKRRGTSVRFCVHFVHYKQKIFTFLYKKKHDLATLILFDNISVGSAMCGIQIGMRLLNRNGLRTADSKKKKIRWFVIFIHLFVFRMVSDFYFLRQIQKKKNYQVYSSDGIVNSFFLVAFFFISRKNCLRLSAFVDFVFFLNFELRRESFCTLHSISFSQSWKQR